ncbi:hypothetical protein [uncultured Methylobacterium sp.]|uniref:hypothetical protein n=1 Tax=uncultured Methylobacterium sp. TaxID=157278 RepID=UPI0035CC9B4A
MVEATLRHLRFLRLAGPGCGVGTPGIAHAAAWAGLLGIALLRAWQDPAAVCPAAALAAALVLDGAGRLAAAGLAPRNGPDPRLSGLPSLVLGAGDIPGLTLGAVALMLVPHAVPVLASALAGLLAIGALARLALIRLVLGLSEVQATDASPVRPAPNLSDSDENPLLEGEGASTTLRATRPDADGSP